MKREILFRGKTIFGSRWVYGVPVPIKVNTYDTKRIELVRGHNYDELDGYYMSSDDDEVIPETIGQYTGLTDKNGTKIFEGDIVEYITYDGFDCYSVVKIGEYKQDGSDDEYIPTKCLGTYVEVDNFTCPDWCDNEPEYFREYRKTQNLLEVAKECWVIGNIYDNPELLYRK